MYLNRHLHISSNSLIKPIEFRLRRGIPTRQKCLQSAYKTNRNQRIEGLASNCRISLNSLIKQSEFNEMLSHLGPKDNSSNLLTKHSEFNDSDDRLSQIPYAQFVSGEEQCPIRILFPGDEL